MDAHRRARTACLAAIAAASLLAVAAAPAGAEGDQGPLTCLDGFVWRQATPRDHVCVTPEVRAQTVQDNALAPSRASAASGTSGPDLCGPGYVRREAVPGDHVCVMPATWQQVHDDNRTAGWRRNALRVKLGAYRAADGSNVRRYWVHADGINAGVARVGLFRPGRSRPAMSWPVTATRSANIPGAELFLATPLAVCGGPPNAILRVRDPSSHRWSSSRRVATGCAAG